LSGDGAGSATVVGEWTIGARDGHELASGRFRHSEPLAQAGFAAMAAAMSRNLAAVSADIANALGRLRLAQQDAQARPRRMR
jgi:uncharacterized lipoprotein YmbA